MATTFDEMARSLRLYVPQLPYTLAQQFIRDRYRRILERRPWSGLRGEGEFILNASKQTGTVTITFNSATVTGSGTSFASSDVGRQFKVGVGSPIYTITVVVGQTLTLDRNSSVATGSNLSYRVFDGYVTCPSDFMRFITVVDPVAGWRIRHWLTQDELMLWDPQRTFFSQPYCLFDRRFSSTGAVQYEAWPYTTMNRGLVFYYIKRAADLTNPTDSPIWPIRSDIIVKGALSDVSLWPGTKDNPNLYFERPDVWKAFQAQYEDELEDLERQDEDIYLTWYASSDWHSMPFAPLSANYIQSHAI